MKKIVSIGRDIPGLAPKPKKTNKCTLEASKNWLGELVVKAIAWDGKCAGEKVFKDTDHLAHWATMQFGYREENRLFPSDVDAILAALEKGVTAVFPIKALLHDLPRYGLHKPVAGA